MKEPKLTKEGKLPQLHNVRARLYADDIMQLFLERLNNHTLSEVCKYIAGYFYREQIANFNKMKQAAERIKKLEEALEPFAKWADAYEPDEGDDHLTAWDHAPTIGMLRAARNALGELK